MAESRVAHLEWRKPAQWLFIALFFPVTLALMLDAMLGTMPLATMVVGLVCIPLSTVLVVHSVLAEMDRVIEIVAPATEDEVVNDSATSESMDGGSLPDASA